MNRNVTVLVGVIVLAIVIVVLASVASNRGFKTATDLDINATSTNSTSTRATSTATSTRSTTTATTTSASTTATTTQSNIRVIYSDSGFTPSLITIKKGDSVTWINNSSGRMWVASNPHPEHTDYPALDERTSVANGQSWTFRFTEAGTYGYHNHANVNAKGSVTVQ